MWGSGVWGCFQALGWGLSAWNKDRSRVFGSAVWLLYCCFGEGSVRGFSLYVCVCVDCLAWEVFVLEGGFLRFPGCGLRFGALGFQGVGFVGLYSIGIAARDQRLDSDACSNYRLRTDRSGSPVLAVDSATFSTKHAF